jgi:hypothetical protein
LSNAHHDHDAKRGARRAQKGRESGKKGRNNRFAPFFAPFFNSLISLPFFYFLTKKGAKGA